MDFNMALFLFFSGVFAHALGIRLFKTWSKAIFYKITFINCLAILRFSEDTSKDLLKMMGKEDDDTKINLVFANWQKMTLLSLKSLIPDKIWREIAIEDWERAMKLLSSLEKKGAQNEN